MKFDNVLDKLGHFGPYQRRIYIILGLPTIVIAMHKLIWVFIGAKPHFRCRLDYDNIYLNSSYYLPEAIQEANIPWDSSNGQWAQCSRFDELNRTIDCDQGYVYDTSVYKDSVVTEWDLVCDNAYIAATSKSLFMFGVFIGSIGFGVLSDYIGRRKAFFISLIMQVICGILAGVADNFWLFVIARLLVGISTCGFLVAFCISMEMVGPSWRVSVGVLSHMFFTVGYLFTAIIAYYIREWHWLQIVISIPGILFLPYYWIVPESIRWLLSKGKIDEAEKIVYQAAKINGVTLIDNVFSSEKTALVESEEKALLDNRKPAAAVGMGFIFRYPRLCLRSLNIFFNWFVNSGVYYGLSLNTSNIGGNDFINFAITGAVEVPAYLFVIFAVNKLGRRLPLFGCMVLAGLSMSSIMFIPKDNRYGHVPVIILSTIGKLFITASYGLVYLFTAELFPTVIRNSGVGASSTCARIGGILAPFVIMLASTWRPLPYLIFGTMSIIAGVLSLLLPETQGKRMPETLDDGEKYATPEYESLVSDNIDVTFSPIKFPTEKEVMNGISINASQSEDQVSFLEEPINGKSNTYEKV